MRSMKEITHLYRQIQRAVKNEEMTEQEMTYIVEIPYDEYEISERVMVSIEKFFKQKR